MVLDRWCRAVYASAWVGWQVESNWIDPFIFIGIQVIRPLATTLLFPLLYIVGASITGLPVDSRYLTYILLGTVFFTPFVSSAEAGGQLVSQDRERYGVMKSIYITSSSLMPYVFGRYLAIMFISTVSTAASMASSYALFTYGLQIPLKVGLENVAALLISVAAIYIGSAAIFYLLPSVNLLTNKLQWSLTYYVLGFLYLFGEILYPLETLSPNLTFLSYVLPVNQPLNAARAAFGLQTEYNPFIALAAPAAWLLLATWVFRLAVRYSRVKGLLDKIGWW